MIALGAGVAGLQAIATARRLGAVVHGFDVRAAAREQVESLGAKFVSVDDTDIGAGEGVGGYAREQSRDQQARLRRALSAHLATMQLLVKVAVTVIGGVLLRIRTRERVTRASPFASGAGGSTR
jgi:H+-translocating NAD(P) transhydrogenase subunit alpha